MKKGKKPTVEIKDEFKNSNKNKVTDYVDYKHSKIQKQTKDTAVKESAERLKLKVRKTLGEKKNTVSLDFRDKGQRIRIQSQKITVSRPKIRHANTIQGKPDHQAKVNVGDQHLHYLKIDPSNEVTSENSLLQDSPRSDSTKFAMYLIEP